MAGTNCQVCGKLSGIPGMGFCFSCATRGPEWAQHETIAWLEHEVGKQIQDDINQRKHMEERVKAARKKSNKLKLFYY